MDMRRVREALACPLESVVPLAGAKQASVLVIIYGTEPRVLLIRKPGNLRIHAGEIAFPGGKYEVADSDVLETALRETREEVGLDIARSDVIGMLKPVSTLNTGYHIFPFVAVLRTISSPEPSGEVAEVFTVPLESLLGTCAPDMDPAHRSMSEMYTFEFEGKIVWGASARILHQMARRLGMR